MKDKKAFIQKMASLIGLMLLIIFFSATNNYFFSFSNAMTVGLQTATIAYIGIGVTFVILTGGIDLSIGSVAALSGVTAALSMVHGIPTWGGVGIGLLTGALCGAVNGFIIIKFKLPPFIATLGIMMVARGVALYITNASPVSNLPASFAELGGGAVFRTFKEGPLGDPIVAFPGIPYPILIMILLFIVCTFILTKLRVGRYLYAIGSNEEAARLSGVNVGGVKLLAYVISGTLAGLCGIIITARLVTAQPNGGMSYELDAIASSVVGGTSLMGGVGTIPGALIGSFVIGVLRNGLNMNGVSSFVQQILIGVVIIFTVSLDQFRNRTGGSKKTQAKKQTNTNKPGEKSV
jgi:ribose transport system permease protein